MNTDLLYLFSLYFFAAALLAAVLVPMMRPLAFRIGAVDKGEGRRVHKGTIPRLGGIGIFLAILISTCFSLMQGDWNKTSYSISGILIVSTIIFFIGLIDDIKHVRVRYKLVVEIMAAVLLYFWGIRIDIINNPFGSKIILGWMALPATVLWMLIITNAINLIDGMDGLAAGTGILIAGTFFIFSGSDIHIQLVYVILAGSLLGFLFYNFPPASIFMGDSGSLFLGFFLGAVSMISTRKTTVVATIMIPLIAFLLPLLDMFFAVIRRYVRGIPLSDADREHIHHKLLELGLSKRKVLLLLYSFNIIAMFIVFSFSRSRINIDFVALIFVSIIALVGLRIFGYIDFKVFLKELVRSLDISRKRKYYTFVIKRFKQNTDKCKSFDELGTYLSELMREFNFRAVYIFLSPEESLLYSSVGDKGLANPILPDFQKIAPSYTYISEKGLDMNKRMEVLFPIFRGGRQVGCVQINKEQDEAEFICTPEMIKALSETISRFV